eukprot:1972519-Prymnesium_polylepis.1
MGLWYSRSGRVKRTPSKRIASARSYAPMRTPDSLRLSSCPMSDWSCAARRRARRHTSRDGRSNDVERPRAQCVGGRQTGAMRVPQCGACGMSRGHLVLWTNAATRTHAPASFQCASCSVRSPAQAASRCCPPGCSLDTRRPRPRTMTWCSPGTWVASWVCCRAGSPAGSRECEGCEGQRPACHDHR